MLGTGRSYLGFFLRGWGLTARGGRHGTWFSRKKVTMKGCLDRGPLRPTNPIQPADKERSRRWYNMWILKSRWCCAWVDVRWYAERRAKMTELRLEREKWLFPICFAKASPYPPLSRRRGVCPGCCGGWVASGWKLWWHQRPANPPDLQAPTAHQEEPGLAPFKNNTYFYVFSHILLC